MSDCCVSGVCLESGNDFAVSEDRVGWDIGRSPSL